MPTITPNGVVEEGNTEAVSGGEVYSHVNNITPQQTTFAKRGDNLFFGKFENISVLTIVHTFFLKIRCPQ